MAYETSLRSIVQEKQSDLSFITNAYGCVKCSCIGNLNQLRLRTDGASWTKRAAFYELKVSEDAGDNDPACGDQIRYRTECVRPT
jgi:hypothetical protein